MFAATERIFLAGNSRNGMLRKIAFEILNKKSGYGQYVIRIFLFCLLKMFFSIIIIFALLFLHTCTQRSRFLKSYIFVILYNKLILCKFQRNTQFLYMGELVYILTFDKANWGRKWKNFLGIFSKKSYIFVTTK